jgi:hypothetical protein
VTNSLMLLNALLGFGIVLRHRKRQQQKGTPAATGRKFETGQA